jgi:formylglycine-generating enzyme required for sulfatase activity
VDPNITFENPMIDIPAGVFQMGGEYTGASGNSLPVHEVTLPSYKISKYEVTALEWDVFMPDVVGYNEYYPVKDISKLDMMVYCNLRSIDEGLEACYHINGETDYNLWEDYENIECNFSNNGYRLPTEAEWEYAARGGADSPNYDYSGSNNITEVAWSNDHNGEFNEVGIKKENYLGLHDMSGGVWEMCWETFSEYNSASQNDPQGSSNEESYLKGVIRGGSYNIARDFCKVITRENSIAFNKIGFRLVRRDN